VSGLISHGDGGDNHEKCAFCGGDAAGPCASCKRSVCGDCCTLTEGGANVWAICLECDRKKGRSLSSSWGGFGTWLLAILIALGAVVGLMEWCDQSGVR
jgi:hypothetical protein